MERFILRGIELIYDYSVEFQLMGMAYNFQEKNTYVNIYGH